MVVDTCQTVHDEQLRGLTEAGDHHSQGHRHQGGHQDPGQQLRPGVGHLGDDQLAADVGEHRPGQVEHAAGVLVQDVVGGETDPDEEQGHGQQG